MEDTAHLLQYTIPQLLRWRVNTSPSKVALREKDFGHWKPYTWEQYYAFVRKIALGLECIGLKRQDKVALIGDNIPEMFYVAIGTHSMGGVTAGIYQTSLPEEIADIINYLEVSLVFCDDQEQVDKLITLQRNLGIIWLKFH